MKKVMWVFICVFMLFSLSSLVNAQSAAGMERPRFGLGVSIGKEIAADLVYYEGIVLKTVDFPNFYIPIQVSPGIRLEPYFGYWKYSYKYSNASTYKEKYSLMDIGVGVFMTTWCGPVNLYYGGRIGMLKYSYSEESTGSDKYTQKRTDWVYGLAVGGEYFFTNNLSFGGEVQFNYMKMGDFKTNEDENDHESDYESSTSFIFTRPLIFVRWYFGCR